MTILSMVMPSFSQDLPRSSWDKRGEPLFISDDGGDVTTNIGDRDSW